MQRDEVRVICDVCGAEFIVGKQDALRHRYTLPVSVSIDAMPDSASVESCQVDLCRSCEAKAVTMRCVKQTRERYVEEVGTIREQTGRRQYSFMEEG